MTGQPTAAEVLRQHAPIGDGWNCACGWAAGARHEDHQADMLAAAGLLVTPEHDAQVAARALREAAGSIDGPDWAGYEYAAADWLNARADRIERGEAT